NSALGIRRSVVSSHARRLALRRPERPGNNDCSPTWLSSLSCARTTSSPLRSMAKTWTDPPHDNIGAVAGFAFPEDQRRGWELDDLGDVGKRPELAGLEIAEQSQAPEELLAFWRNHDSFRVIGSTTSKT